MKPVTIIGAGAVGRSIALALFSGGVSIAGVYSIRGHSARVLAKKIYASSAGSIDSIISLSPHVIICVPDRAIASVARFLASTGIPLKGKTILHVSGALTGDELSAVQRKGAAVGSLHPLQTFPRSHVTPLRNVWMAVEGGKKVQAFGKKIAGIVKARSFMISKEAKVHYHIAGVFASNYVVTLLSAVEQSAAAAGIPRKKRWKIFMPIVQQSVRNAVALTPAKALTGPISRGDLKTVRRHLNALGGKELRPLKHLYTALGIETARLAAAKKRKRK